jgi:hypothetical protein
LVGWSCSRPKPAMHGCSIARQRINIAQAGNFEYVWLDFTNMAIVHSSYRPKRARKRKVSPAIPQRIVTIATKRATAVEPQPPETQASREPKKSRIVTVRNPRSSRFGSVPEMTADEHQRRGDAAEALFREIAHRAREE